MTREKHLVTTAWLKDNIDNDDIVILDGSIITPATARMETNFIPGAIHFDIDRICDPDSDLPHMLPDPELFAALVGAMGLGNDKRIIVYSRVGIYSAARVWWMFRAMGFDNIVVLDGGLPKWKSDDGAMNYGILPSELPEAKTFVAQFRPRLVADIDDMFAFASGKNDLTVIDARAAARFNGSQAESNPDMRCGHIPGTVNLPFTDLLNPDQTMVDEQKLRQIFAGLIVDLTNKAIVTTCGSGVTATIIALALAIIDYEEVAVYDGSWSEWGRRQDTPVAAGA